MLSLQTLTQIEALLLSRSHPMWGEFMPLAQVISEVQVAKQALTQPRVQPAPARPTADWRSGPTPPAQSTEQQALNESAPKE